MSTDCAYGRRSGEAGSERPAGGGGEEEAALSVSVHVLLC